MLRNLKEILGYFRRKKKLWVVPLVLLLLLVGLFAVVTSSDAVAPVIYTLF